MNARQVFARSHQELVDLGASDVEPHPKRAGIWRGRVFEGAGVVVGEELAPGEAPAGVVVETVEAPAAVEGTVPDADGDLLWTDGQAEVPERPATRWWRVPADNTLHATKDAAVRWRRLLPELYRGACPVEQTVASWTWRKLNPPVELGEAQLTQVRQLGGQPPPPPKLVQVATDEEIAEWRRSRPGTKSSPISAALRPRSSSERS